MMYEPIICSQMPILEIQRGTIITPEVYEELPEFQESVEGDNIEAMCDEYNKLCN
jgi:hypothetical protein